jgi:hypothetical protein
MAVKALNILKKGLNTLEKQVKNHKEGLLAILAEKKTISSEDKAWLNHEVNMVDEQQVIEALKTALDYERGF